MQWWTNIFSKGEQAQRHYDFYCCWCDYEWQYWWILFYKQSYLVNLVLADGNGSSCLTCGFMKHLILLDLLIKTLSGFREDKFIFLNLMSFVSIMCLLVMVCVVYSNRVDGRDGGDEGGILVTGEGMWSLTCEKGPHHILSIAAILHCFVWLRLSLIRGCLQRYRWT